MNGKTSGYVNCYNTIEKAILKNSIVCQPFTVYFDNKQLEDIRDYFGYDLYIECLLDVKINYGFE